MGAGVAYPYEYHILVDYFELTSQVDDDGNDVDPEDYDNDQSAADWEHFKDEVMRCFGAVEMYEQSEGRERYLFAETDRLYIGVDHSGADSTSCIYLKSKTWERCRTRREGRWTYYDSDEIEYNINRDAERGFNRLIRRYGNLMEYWTGGYTTSAYGPRKDGRYVRWSKDASPRRR